MDRKLLAKRVEVVFAVLLVVVVILGIAVLLFRAIPSTQDNVIDNQGELLPGFPSDPNELIKFLDLNGQKEFTASNKKVTLPGDSVITAAYNKTSLSEFDCKDISSTECTIYEVSFQGRTFYISSPIVLRLKQTTAAGQITKELPVAGENVTFTYTQRKFFTPQFNDQGEITSSIEDPTAINIEEISGCLSTKICFNSGRLINEKAQNDLDVTSFEQFVESIVVI